MSSTCDLPQAHDAERREAELDILLVDVMGRVITGDDVDAAIHYPVDERLVPVFESEPTVAPPSASNTREALPKSRHPIGRAETAQTDSKEIGDWLAALGRAASPNEVPRRGSCFQVSPSRNDHTCGRMVPQSPQRCAPTTAGTLQLGQLTAERSLSR